MTFLEKRSYASVSGFRQVCYVPFNVAISANVRLPSRRGQASYWSEYKGEIFTAPFTSARTCFWRLYTPRHPNECGSHAMRGSSFKIPAIYKPILQGPPTTTRSSENIDGLQSTACSSPSVE